MRLLIYSLTAVFLLLSSCSKNEDKVESICDNPKGNLSANIAEGVNYKSTLTTFIKAQEENTVIVDSYEYTEDCFWIGALCFTIEKKLGTQQLKKSLEDGTPEKGESHFIEVDIDVILGNFFLDEGKAAWVDITSIDEQSIKGILQATYAFDSNSPNRFITLPDTLMFNKVSFEAVLP